MSFPIIFPFVFILSQTNWPRSSRQTTEGIGNPTLLSFYLCLFFNLSSIILFLVPCAGNPTTKSLFLYQHTRQLLHEIFLLYVAGQIDTLIPPGVLMSSFCVDGTVTVTGAIPRELLRSASLRLSADRLIVNLVCSFTQLIIFLFECVNGLCVYVKPRELPFTFARVFTFA